MGFLPRGGVQEWAELKIQMWEGVADFGGVAGAQEQRGGPEASLSRWQWREAIPLTMGLLMAMKYGMTLDLVIK